MRMTLFATFLVALPLLAQQPNVSGGTPGVIRPGPQEGCPLRAVKAVIDTISPKGEIVLKGKGELVVGRITDETRFDIPGYDRKQLRKGANVKLEPDTKVRARICEWNGDVYHLKVLEQGKKPKK